jgi:single-strand DNA-binding protein
MPASLNRVMLIGWLEHDPEMRYSPDGRPVTSFNVTTTFAWESAIGERHEEKEWFHVVAWDELAQNCKEHLYRGVNVYVVGRLQTRGWENKEGRTVYRLEVVAQEMVALGEMTV